MARNHPAAANHRPTVQFDQQTSLLSRLPGSARFEQHYPKSHATRTETMVETEIQDAPRSPRHWLSIANWWQEMLAIFLLVASTIASFATLYPYQGKPLPDWPYAISIGALLSAYSVVLRLAATFLLSEGLAQAKWRWFNSARPLYDIVLHDNASRGPMGAFGLLWRLPWPVTWQWMGCILVLVALLVGPFTQQVIQYEVCAVPVAESTAVVPRTSVFIGQGIGDRRDPSAPYITLTMPEQSAVNTGIYTPGTGSFSCDSGNCTFAPYSSVGYCSSCEDISSAVRFREVNDTTTTFVPDLINMPSVNYVPVKQYSAHGSGPVVQHYATGVLNHVQRDFFTALIGLPGIPTDPLTGLAPTACESQATNQTWRCKGFAAVSCAVFPCIRTYSANVTNGVLHEEVIETERNALRLSSGSWFDKFSQVYAALKVSCLNDKERDTLRKRNYTLDANMSWISYNITSAEDQRQRKGSIIGEESVALEQGFVDRGCLYAVDAEFDDSLQQFIGAFGGYLTGKAANKVLRSLNGSQVLQSIYNYGNGSLLNTQSLFDNMTTSLSNYMRRNPGSTEMVRKSWTFNWTLTPDGPLSNLSLDAGTLMTPATGQAWATRTCVGVRWPWLALPVALALLTLVFFVGVSSGYGNLPHDVRTWKTSPLPLMFYGPGVNDVGNVTGRNWSGPESQHVDDMNTASKRLDVALVCNEHIGLARFEHIHAKV